MYKFIQHYFLGGCQNKYILVLTIYGGDGGLLTCKLDLFAGSLLTFLSHCGSAVAAASIAVAPEITAASVKALTGFVVDIVVVVTTEFVTMEGSVVV